MDASAAYRTLSAAAGAEMGGERFDSVARALARQRSPRGVFGALGGGALGMCLRPAAFAAKKKHNKASGDGDESEVPIPGAQVGGIWDHPIAICRWVPESGERQVMGI